MSKQFLYIIDPLATLEVKGDTSLVIMEEAGVRGFTNFVCELHDIALRQDKLQFCAQQVHLERGYQHLPKTVGAPQLKSADEFAAIFMRKDPPVDQAYITALLMLRQAPQSTLMINSPDGLLLANEKLSGLGIAPQFFSPTLVASNRDMLLKFVNEQETVALKPLFAFGGAGVLVLNKDDRNLNSALELLTASFTHPVIAQAYIKDARAGDKRVLILGGKPIGALLRVPGEHDHRANLHAGGSPAKAELTDRDRAIVQAIAPFLLQHGLHFVGIDIIGGFLTEINVTSPTCVVEIEQYSLPPGAQLLRTQILDYIEKLLA